MGNAVAPTPMRGESRFVETERGRLHVLEYGFLAQIRLGRTQPTADDLRPFFPSMADDHLALRAAWLPTCDETAVAETYRGFHEEDFFDFWPLLQPPVLFLWGGMGPVVTAESTTEVATTNPGAEVVCLVDAGHMLPWDDLPGFLGAVREFLDHGVQAHAETVGTRAGIDA